MSCKRTSTSLVVAALLISLLALHLPVTHARRVAVLKANNNGVDVREDVDLAKEPSVSSIDDLAMKKGLEMRKLGARNMERTEAMGVREAAGDQKGLAGMNHLKKKPKVPSMQTQDVTEAPVSWPASHGNTDSPPRTAVEMHMLPAVARRPSDHRLKPRRHRAAAAEMYDMLSRDYSSRARRRSPINNGEPLQEEEP